MNDTTTFERKSAGWQAMCDGLTAEAMGAHHISAGAARRKRGARHASSRHQEADSARHLYLQASCAFLLGMRRPALERRHRFATLARTSMGISLRLEVDLDSHTAPDWTVDAIEAPRELGLAWLNLHLGHPRFAALRRAMQFGSAASARASYDDFDERLRALCKGQLSESEAAALSSDLLSRALTLAGCENVTIDPRIHTLMQVCDQLQTWSIHEVAMAVGLSASRMSHIFTDEIGISFRQYMQSLRTQHAWEQVATAPARSLTEIAHAEGFSDLAHMSNSFRAIFGHTPSEFRDPRKWKIVGRPAEPGVRVPERWNPATAQA